jgi:hypothetical protein
MARLIAFGCSFTRGDGLQDRSTQAWPAVLSQLLGRTCVNKGIQGASNKEIWSAIVDTRYKPSDIVFVNWSFCHRAKFNHQQLIATRNPMTEEEEFYYKKLYTKKHGKDEWIVHMNHAGRYLRSKNLKMYNTVIERNMGRWLPRYNMESILPAHWEKYQHKYEKALDGLHPGPLAHAAFAQKVYELI